MLQSLRARLFWASFFWTVGLLAVMHLASLGMVHVFPAMRQVGFGWPLVIGVFCMASGVFGLYSGLSPFRELRSRLSSVRSGSEPRLEGKYPSEVLPLIDDLNALLDDREKAVKRAKETAADLAHGLKTPLAVLAQEAEKAGAAGHLELAQSIGQQVERMRRQVDYHLAFSRATSSAAQFSRCEVLTSADGLARTLLRLHASRGLRIDVRVPTQQSVRVQREDLDEMLGNLLDNACKWAQSLVNIESSQLADTVTITVDDDGPGLAKSMHDAVLQRGVRADQAVLGSGLGLAIVRDLAELYGGSISLADGPSGGLRALLRLPGLNISPSR